MELVATADSCFASAAAAARTAAPIGFVFFAPATPVPKPDNAFDIKALEEAELELESDFAAVVVAVVAAVNMNNGLLLLKDLILLSD